MREPNWLALLLVLGAIFVGGIFFGSMGKGDLRAEASAWRRSAAENDRLVQVAHDQWRRASVELGSTREARAILEERNNDLARQLRGARAEIRELQELVVTAPIDTVIVTATDTFYTDTGVSRVDFVLPFDAGSVVGYTLNPPARAWGELTLDPIPIQVVTSEMPDGSWQTDVTLGGPWELGQLDSFTNPRRPSWWERHDFKVGLGLGTVGILILMSVIGS